MSLIGPPWAISVRAETSVSGAGQRGALQRVLQLVDRLAVVGQALHRLGGGDDLLDGVGHDQGRV
jgi:hypothetical protein